MSQNPIRDFLEACTTQLTWNDLPVGEDSVVAADVSTAEGELVEGELARG